MNTGVYEEVLPCGGKLKVNQSSWEIFYYFEGPDLRYNGDIVIIRSDEIHKYIEAYQENWKTFKSIKDSIPDGGEFTKAGVKDMSIRVGGFAEGVCLYSYHLPVATENKLNAIIEGYRYAEKRAVKIQEFLKKL